MYLYVYKVVDKISNEYYIGSRKSIKEPILDTYLGSPKVWKPIKSNLIKTILKEGFVIIEDMIQFEAKCIKKSIKDPLNQNYRIPNSKFYNKNGKCGKANGAFGRKWITNNIETKYVMESEVLSFLKLGWRLGHNRQTGFSKKGRVWITNGNSNKYIFENETIEFLNSGWYLGKTYSEESLQKIKSVSHISAISRRECISEKLSTRMKGAIHMNDGIKNYRVEPINIISKELLGWKRGRINYIPHNKKPI